MADPPIRDMAQLFLNHGPNARRIAQQFVEDFGEVTKIFVLAPESTKGQKIAAEFQALVPEGAEVLLVSVKGYLLSDVATSSEDVCVLNDGSLEQVWVMARLSHDHCKAVIFEPEPTGSEGKWRSFFTSYPDAGRLMGM
jgi:hypothetical protein